MTNENETAIFPEAYDLTKTGSDMTSNSDEHSDSAISGSSRVSHNSPPPNVAEGGVWGTIKNRNLFMISCAQEKETYAVWGRMRDGKGKAVGRKDILLYDTEGNLLGPRKNFRWVPKRNV